VKDSNEKCATCGHDRSQHIYEEGACRPGFICAEHCEEFKAAEPAPELPSFKILKPGDYLLSNYQRVSIDYMDDGRNWVGRVWAAGEPDDTNRHRWNSDGTNFSGATDEAREILKIVAHWAEPRDLRADIRAPDAQAWIRENEVLKQNDEVKKAYTSGLAHRQAEAIREDRVFQAAIHLMRMSFTIEDAKNRAVQAVHEAEELVAEIERTRERRKVLFK